MAMAVDKWFIKTAEGVTISPQHVITIESTLGTVD